MAMIAMLVQLKNWENLINLRNICTREFWRAPKDKIGHVTLKLLNYATNFKNCSRKLQISAKNFLKILQKIQKKWALQIKATKQHNDNP